MEQQDKKDSLTEVPKGVNEAREFLNALYKDYFKDHTGFIQLQYPRIIEGERKYPDQAWATSIDEVLKQVGSREDFIFGVAPRYQKGGTKQDIQFITTLWVEVDTKEGGFHEDAEFEDKEEALQHLKNIESSPYPSIIIDSGHGLHLYWLLDRPVYVESIEYLEGILKGINIKYNGDNSQSLQKLLRIPGTYNCRGEKTLIRTIDNNFKRYSIEDFQYFELGIRPPAPEINLNIEDKSIDIETLTGLDEETIDLIMRKRDNTKGLSSKYISKKGLLDRSIRDMKVITNMLRGKHTHGHIYRLFKNPKYPLSDKYLSLERRSPSWGDNYIKVSIREAERYLAENSFPVFMYNQENADYLRLSRCPSMSFIEVVNGQQLLSFMYNNKARRITIRGDVNKEALALMGTGQEEIEKYQDNEMEQRVCSWLMHQKASLGLKKVESSIKMIAKDLYGDKKIRAEDYKKIEVALKCIAYRQFTFVERNIARLYNPLINLLIFDKNNLTFACSIADYIKEIPKEKEKISREAETLFVKKTFKEYNPRQSAYEFKLRQYITDKLLIRDPNHAINNIRGFLILEEAGYNADIYFKRKAYRNKEAQGVIDLFIRLCGEYGTAVFLRKESLTIRKPADKHYRLDFRNIRPNKKG